MAQTGIIWGGWSGRLRIGLNIRWDDIGPSTTQSHVWADWYVTSHNAFNDSQRINFNYSLGGYWDYHLNTPNGYTDRFLGTYDIGVHGVGYSGGGAWNFGAYITGAYEGSSPSFVHYWAMPARPASAPGLPGIGVDSVTANSARVVVSAAAANGSAINWYGAWVTTNNAVPGSGGNVVASAEGGTFTATGLSPSTTYYAFARARNGVGYSGFAGAVAFTTGATAPGVVTGVTTGTVEAISATLTWSAPSSTGGSAITGYDAQVATNSSFTSGVKTISTNASTRTATFSDLTPGTQYWTRVRAKNGVGAGSYSATGSFTTLQGTPNIVAPTQSQVQTDGVVDVTVNALGIKSDSIITLQISTVSDFSSNVISRTLTPGAPSSNNNYLFRDQTLADSYLKTGTYYARARVNTPSTGYTTPWSATRTYSQSHTPSAVLVTPVTGVTMLYQANVAFTFRFVDSADSRAERMSAYRLVIENNVTGDSVYDSGKTAITPSGTTATVSVPIAAALKNVSLRWRVMLWDRGDTPSAWTGFSVFTLSDAPVVAIIEPPSALPVDNGSPAVEWTFSAPSGGRQSHFEVTIRDQESSQIVWEHFSSGETTRVQPDRVVLLNGRSYTLRIEATDSFGLAGVASRNFFTEYVSPESVDYSIDASGANDLGYVSVDWADADPDSQFVAWKVYRRDDLAAAWEPVITIYNQNQRSYRDYMISSGRTYQYSVTQIAARSGVELESPVGYRRIPSAGGGGFDEITESRIFTVDLTNYWIINPDTPDMSVMLKGVVDDPTTLEFEQASYTIIGRGRHVDYGDELGYSGTLTVQVRGTERQSVMRRRVEDLRRAQETYYLRTPFGRLFQVALGNLGWTPLRGTGTSEMGELTITYMEVA